MDNLISREEAIDALRKLRGVGGIYVWDPDAVLAIIEKLPERHSLAPVGGETQLCYLEPGTLFKFGDCIALKSEYYTQSGAVEAHIVGTGEQFWGGAKTAQEQRELWVQPLELDE